MSSSDDSDDISAFREAVDSSFLNDLMFGNSKAGNTVTRHAVSGAHQEHKVKPSLRNGEREELNDLRVTPEFQKFVAKHLSCIIDKTLKEVETTVLGEEGLVGADGGIKLFSGSSGILEHGHEGSLSTQMQRKGARKCGKHSVRSREDLASVAVSADWVLSGEATRGWSIPTTGEVIIAEAAPAKNRSDGGSGACSRMAGSEPTSVDGTSQKRKSQEWQKLLHDPGTKIDSGASGPSVDCETYLDLKKQKKSEKRKRQRLKKKAGQTNDKLIT